MKLISLIPSHLKHRTFLSPGSWTSNFIYLETEENVKRDGGSVLNVLEGMPWPYRQVVPTKDERSTTSNCSFGSRTKGIFLQCYGLFTGSLP